MKRLVILLCLAACSSKPAPTKPSAAPAPAPTAAEDCPAGQMMHDGACIKECTQDSECGEGGHCEQLHSMNEDGTIGPVSGNGCQ